MHSKYEILHYHFVPKVFILFLVLRGFYPLQMPKNIDNVETSYAMETHTHTPHHTTQHNTTQHNTTQQSWLVFIWLPNQCRCEQYKVHDGVTMPPLLVWVSPHNIVDIIQVVDLNIAILEHAQSTMPMPILLCYYLDMEFKCI